MKASFNLCWCGRAASNAAFLTSSWPAAEQHVKPQHGRTWPEGHSGKTAPEIARVCNLPETSIGKLRSSETTSMRRWVLLVHLIILAGCADRLGPLWGSAPSPFTPGFYQSSANAPLATPLPTVAVYQFVDKRPVPDPTFLGEHPFRTGT